MTAADIPQIKITFSLKKITMHKTAPLQWNANKSLSLVKLTPILQICSKENLPITTVTITSLTTE
jgi:hypothetical protein